MNLRLKLSHKILLLVLLPLAFELTFVAMLAMLLQQSDQQVAREARARAIVDRLNIIAQHHLEMASALGAYRLTHNASIVDTVHKRLLEDYSSLQELVASDPRELLAAQQAAAINSDELKICDQVRDAFGRGEAFKGNSAFQLVIRKERELGNSIDIIRTQERRTAEMSPVTLSMARQHIRTVLLTGAALNIVLAVVLVLYFNRSTARRLEALMDNIVRLARGVPLNPPVTGSDEIALLDKVFNDMANALATAAQKERSIIDHAQDVICSIDRSGRLIAVSPACSTVWDYSVEELVGKHYLDLIVPEDQQSTLDSVGHIKLSNSPGRFENRVCKKSGATVHMLWSVYWSAAEESLFCVAHDITERKLAEDRLVESESRIRHIMESIPVGLMIIDEKGNIEVVNSALSAMFGYDRSELNDKSSTVLFPKAGDLLLSGDLLNGAYKSVGHNVELDAIKKNGSALPVELFLTALNTSEGNRFLVIVIDVSERHEVERLKQQFVAVVSHELKTPLTSVQVFLESLSAGRYGSLNEKGYDRMNVVERNVSRLVSLISDLIDVERHESGRLEMHFAEVCTDFIIARALDSVQAFAEQHDVSLITSTVNVQVLADGERLAQVLINLISNAVKFSPKGGAVTISATEMPGFIEIRVIDQGRGIPSHSKGRIFERFQQVEAADTYEKGGSGLGLAICKAIIQQHSGEIGVESEEGKGSVFWFRIPLLAKTSILKVS